MKKFAVPLLLALAVSLSACQSTRNQDADFLGSDSDSVTGTPLGNRNESVNFMAGNVNKSMFEPVYFQYDSFEIPGSEVPKLQKVSGYLKSNRGEIIIAGFTDERGTSEYNRALGEKRALAVREALGQMGAPVGRLQTVSFGEEMPVGGGGESGWARDRRAEFGLAQ